MEDASRVFWLKRSADPIESERAPFATPPPGSAGEEEHRARLFRHYPAIRDWVQRCRAPGVVMVALGDEGVEAKAFLSAKSLAINTAIVGRHERAEVRLPEDPSISPRHLAVMVYPRSRRGGVRFRLLDLRTVAGVTDEHGERLHAVDSDAPALIGCGCYSILFVPWNADEPRWPETPQAVWSRIAERDSGGGVLASPVATTSGLLGSEEEALGELSIVSEDGARALPVGRSAARCGILLGRSERCDGDVLLGNPHISRVHLLILEMGGALYAIDTASMNGVWGSGGVKRVTALESGTRISLCGCASVEWRFFH